MNLVLNKNEDAIKTVGCVNSVAGYYKRSNQLLYSHSHIVNQYTPFHLPS